MIVLNNKANHHVKEGRVCNFYPKNQPRTAPQSMSSGFSTQDNFFRLASSTFGSIPQGSPSPMGLQRKDLVQSSQNLQNSLQNQMSIFNSSGQVFSRQQQRSQQSDCNFFQTGMTDEAIPKQKLNESRKIRQDMEENVELLKNRINLLALEEQRTLKKMIGTQKQTIEIINNKTNHTKRLEKKQEERMELEEQKVRRQFALKQMREEKKERDNLMKNMRVQSAKMQVQRIKQLKDQYSMHSQLMNSEMMQRKSQNYLTVKQHENELSQKRLQLDESHRNLAHQIYLNKCKMEISKKVQNEQFYLELEHKEQELLKKLQLSQNLQHKALQDMANATSTPASLLPNKSYFLLKNDSHSYFVSE